MKHYKKQQREVDSLEMITCNWCDAKIGHPVNWDGDIWDGMCATFELDLMGSHSGDSSRKWSADFCFECSQKVVGLLVKAGVAIEEKEGDF